MGEATERTNHEAAGAHTRQPSLIGREHEQGLLRLQLDTLLSGRGRLVLVNGEAGIGKTALVDAFAESARRLGAVVLSGSCYDLTITPPYGPWIDALGTLQQIDERSNLAGTLRDATSLTGMTREEIFEQVRGRLADLASQKPMVLLLEDLHWADAATLDLLRSVSRQLEGVPLLIVATWRDDEETPQLSALVPALIREAKPLRIALQRLSDRDLLTLVSQRYRLIDDERDALSDVTQSLSEGNPFFAGEILFALEQKGALHLDNDGWHFNPQREIGVPPVVRQVIEQRLSRVSEATQRVLEYAAIIGQDAAVVLLQRAADVTDEEFGASLDEAIANHIIAETPAGDLTMRFRHSLVRETLYLRQSAVRRRARHRRVAELLLARPELEPARLAFHFRAANDPRCVEWLVRAGEHSLNMYAPQDAITILTRAEESAEHFGTVLPRAALRARGRAQEMIGNFDQARADFELTLTRARADGDRRAEWRALLDLGALWTERDYQRARGALLEALELARRELGEDEVAHSLNAVGNWHLNHEEPEPAIEYHQQALSIFTQSNDQRGIAATFDLLALAQYVAGDVREASRQYKRAVDLLDTLGDRQLLSSALVNWATTGGYFESDANVAAEGTPQHWLAIGLRAVSTARQIGWAAGEAFAQIQIGAMLAARGEMGQAIDLSSAGLRLAEQIGHKQWMVPGHVALGRIHADLLELAPARDHLQAALAQAEAIASSLWTNFSTAALSMLLIDAEDLDAAAEILDRAGVATRSAVSTPQRLCRLAWAQLLIARGEPEQALRVVDALIESAPNASGTRSLPWLALVRGQALAALHRQSEAEIDLGAAQLGARDLGYRHLLVRVDFAIWNLLRVTGREREANSTLDEIEKVVNDIAATLPPGTQRTAYQAAMRRKLPQTTISAGGSLATGLSPREIEVLQLVASGLTDAEVGRQLSISPRTVGRHLESIYNKLGVGSRTGAAAFAYTHGLLGQAPPS